MRRISFLAGIGLLIAGAGCSKSSSRMSIVTSEPANRSNSVAPDTTVSVKFSSGVQVTTLDANSFIITGSQSGRATGTIDYDDASRMATFKPASPFRDGEDVMVVLEGSIRAKSGASLRRHTFTFRIRPAVQPPPPPPPPPDASVVEKSPKAFAASAGDASVLVDFSERMDPLTFTSDSVRMDASLTGRITAQIGQITTTGTRLELTADRDFLPGEWITVRLGNGLGTLAGGGFPGYVFRFQATVSAPATARERGPQSSLAGAPRSTQLGDFDHDGWPDLAYSLGGGTTVEVLRGAGGGRFQAGVSLVAGAEVLNVALADLNDDGFLDVLAASTDRVVTFLGQGSLAFASPETFATGTAVHEIAIGDLDHHGTADVVLDTDKGLLVYQDGLAGSPVLTLGDARVAEGRLVLEDLDLDGDLDLLFAERGQSQLALYRGGGPSGFMPREVLPVGGAPSWVSVADLERNGSPEIIVQTAAAGASQIEILPQPTAGASLQPRLDPLPDADQRSWELADLDGDSLSDLVTSDPAAGTIVLYLNRNGSFDLGNPQELARGLSPQRTLSAEMTGDGVVDLVVLNGTLIETVLSDADEPPPPPPDVQLVMSSLTAEAGETGKTATVRLTSNVAVQGFTIAVAYNAQAMDVTAFDIQGTAVEALAPEFVTPTIRPADGFAALAVAFDLMPPFDGRTLAPGANLALAVLRFSVPSTAAAGSYVLDLQDGLGSPPISNALVHDAESLSPALVDGLLTVTAVTPGNPNVLRIADTVAARDSEGQADVLMTSNVAIDAFTVVGTYDPNATVVSGFSLEGTATEQVAAEFVIPSIRPADHAFIYTAIFDFGFPFDGQKIPAGNNQVILRVIFDVPATAPIGDHLLKLENNIGDPPLSNAIIANAESIYPDVRNGTVTITAEPPAAQFVRGDINGSRRVDLSDYVFLLDYLFHEGVLPPCLEAADVNDSGTINVTDAVNLVDYLFEGEPIPPLPYPNPGPDPTPDGLGCLRGL